MQPYPYDVSNSSLRTCIVDECLLLAGDFDEDLESLIYLFFRLDEVGTSPSHVQSQFSCTNSKSGVLLGMKHSFVLLQI